MKASIKIKSTLASILHVAGVTSWKLRQHPETDVAVLMYHRIIPMNRVEGLIQPGMIVEPDTLDLHLRYLRDQFEIIPLADFASIRRTRRGGLNRRPLCILTFDDGWFDFYEYAYPILKSHGAPATVFLPTDFIGTTRWFWTDRIGILVERAAQLANAKERGYLGDDPLIGELLGISGTHEYRLEKTIALLKPHRIERIEELLSTLSEAMGQDLSPPTRAFVTWEQVQEMSRSGLVCFGSHTAGHPILTTLNEEQVRIELTRSMDDLIGRKVVDPNFISFCYPNGNFTDRLSGMVREAGYHLAVTTRNGWHQEGASPFTINRIPVHQDMTATEAMLASKICNLL